MKSKGIVEEKTLILGKGKPPKGLSKIADALGGMKPPKLPFSMGEDEEEEDEEDILHTDESLENAAGAVREAFESGDDAALAKALKGFIKHCGEY